MKWICIITPLLLILRAKVEGLQCYKCQSLELEPGQTYDQYLIDMFDKNTNQGCRETLDKEAAEIITCRDTIYGRQMKCGLVRGKSELYIPITGRFQSPTWIRDCMDVASGTENVCQGSEQVEELVNERYRTMLANNLESAQLRGEACYCQTNLCPPGGRCANTQFYVSFTNTCVSWFIIGGVGAGVILIILALSCWCCCCRKSRRGIV